MSGEWRVFCSVHTQLLILIVFLILFLFLFLNFQKEKHKQNENEVWQRLHFVPRTSHLALRSLIYERLLHHSFQFDDFLRV